MGQKSESKINVLPYPTAKSRWKRVVELPGRLMTIPGEPFVPGLWHGYHALVLLVLIILLSRNMCRIMS